MFLYVFIFWIIYIALPEYCGFQTCFFKILGVWYGSNRPITAFQTVSSNIETVLDAATLLVNTYNCNRYTITVNLYILIDLENKNKSISGRSWTRNRYKIVSGDPWSSKYTTRLSKIVKISLSIILYNITGLIELIFIY